MADLASFNGRFFEDLARDLTGKGQIRLILQPALAVLLGVRVGFADAKAGKTPFLLRLFTGKHERWTIFKESIKDAAIPLCVALIIDSILQRITLGRVRPLAALVVGLLLVWLPFVAARGLANRGWQRRRARPARRAT